MLSKQYTFDNFFLHSSQLFGVLLAFLLPISTSATTILFILAILLSVFTEQWQGIFPLLFKSPSIKIALLLFALFLIGMSYTSAPFHDALRLLRKYTPLLGMVLLIPIFINPACRKYAIYGFLAAITLTLSFSYLQFFGFSHLPNHHGQAAIFKDRIQTNFLMAFGFYLFAQRLIDLTISNTKNTIKHFRLQQISLTFACFLTLFDILFLSDGRSGYIVFIILILLLAWQKFKWRGLLYTGMALALTLSSTFMLSNNFHNRLLLIHDNIQSYQQGHVQTSVGLRLSFFMNSIKLMAKHPFIGTGTGSFKTEYKDSRNPHNEYLNIGVQLGLPAVVILLLLFYSQWLESQKLTRQYKEIAQAVILAISVGCLGNSWLMDTTEGHFYALFIALCFASNPDYYLKRLNLRNAANDP